MFISHIFKLKYCITYYNILRIRNENSSTQVLYYLLFKLWLIKKKVTIYQVFVKIF